MLLSACGGGGADSSWSGDTVSAADPDRFLEYFDSSDENTRAYARAYYEAVDPLDQRTTLAGWKEASGFNDCLVPIIEVRFRDTKDLGYGRHLHVCTETPDPGPGNGFAAFVDNYQVAPIPELAYSKLNLQAVLRRDPDWAVGTNAIEFSRPQRANGTVITSAPRIAKFFTYTPWPDPGPRQRLLMADLDGRGPKAMPMICVQCHGGTLLPLEPDGDLPRLRAGRHRGPRGGVGGKLQILEVATFDFAASGPFSRTNQEEAIREINAAIYETYATAAYGGPGEWDPAFVRDLVNGWYGGDVTQPGATFDASYVPPGWRPDPVDGFPPVGAGELFREVISPRCVVCHGKRGTTLRSAIQFATWADFVSYAARIEELIYDEGLMPAARVEFDRFWHEGSGEPALLGSFLPGFSHGNPDGTVRMPGRPIAHAGPDRTVAGLPLTLSAADSVFAQAYRWTIVSAPAGATLTQADRARAELGGSGGDGRYRLRLTVTGRDGRTDRDTVTITVDRDLTIAGFAVPAPRALEFHDGVRATVDVRFLLNTRLNPADPAPDQACFECHAATSDPSGPATDFAGIPVFWADNGTRAGIHRVYRDVLARVNTRDPLASPILVNPAGHHHGGGQRPGFNIGAGAHLAYDLMYTWIIEGAPE